MCVCAFRFHLKAAICPKLAELEALYSQLSNPQPLFRNTHRIPAVSYGPVYGPLIWPSTEETPPESKGPITRAHRTTLRKNVSKHQHGNCELYSAPVHAKTFKYPTSDALTVSKPGCHDAPCMEVAMTKSQITGILAIVQLLVLSFLSQVAEWNS